MTTHTSALRSAALPLLTVLALAPPFARAQANAPTLPDEAGMGSTPATPFAAGEAEPERATPPITSPPPQARAPSAGVDSRAPAASPGGQWVYTDQYGWIWMPYGESYASFPAGTIGEPYMYVYGPALGWSWVVAPWLWGYGPQPYFGSYGYARFGWYGGGWGTRWAGWGGPYRGGYGGYRNWYGGGYRGGYGGGYRGGYGPRYAPAPGARGGGYRGGGGHASAPTPHHR